MDSLETLRRQIVTALTERRDVAWTVSSNRLIVRRAGRLLCKVGRDETHVLVEFPLSLLGDVAEPPFLGPPPAGDTDVRTWRQARISSEDEVRQLLGILLGA